MNTLKTAFISGLAIFLLISTGQAQRKTTAKKTTAKKTTTTKTTTVLPPLEVRAAREKVQTQFDNVRLFVDKFGPIASALETLDGIYAKKAPKPESLATHTANKQNVIKTIRNLRDGLAALETEFRTKLALKKYLPSIEGITDLATQSEDSALAGKFVLAKEPLRIATQRLGDTLAVMPKTGI